MIRKYSYHKTNTLEFDIQGNLYFMAADTHFNEPEFIDKKIDRNSTKCSFEYVRRKGSGSIWHCMLVPFIVGPTRKIFICKIFIMNLISQVTQRFRMDRLWYRESSRGMQKPII